MITPQFVTVAQATAKGLGRGSLATVVLPDTFTTMSNEEIREVANKYFEDIVNALTKRR